MKRSSFIALMLAALIAVLPVNVLAGTASGSASTGNGGQNCAKISKSGRGTTGAMTVSEVKVDGKVLTVGADYTIKDGTNHSTRPVIVFEKPLGARANVEVKLSTIEDGTFTVKVSLETCK